MTDLNIKELKNKNQVYFDGIWSQNVEIWNKYHKVFYWTLYSLGQILPSEQTALHHIVSSAITAQYISELIIKPKLSISTNLHVHSLTSIKFIIIKNQWNLINFGKSLHETTVGSMKQILF